MYKQRYSYGNAYVTDMKILRIPLKSKLDLPEWPEKRNLFYRSTTQIFQKGRKRFSFVWKTKHLPSARYAFHSCNSLMICSWYVFLLDSCIASESLCFIYVYSFRWLFCYFIALSIMSRLSSNVLFYSQIIYLVVSNHFAHKNK